MPNNDSQVVEQQPHENWYRQFWPWFLIVLPGSVVIASFYMIFLAVSNPDPVVKDNYYRDGLAINRDLQAVERARELAVSAKVTIDNAAMQVRLSLGGEFAQLPETLILQWVHPTDQKQDLSMTLTRLIATDVNEYSADFSAPLQGRWQVRLSDETQQQWLVNQRVNLRDRRLGSHEAHDTPELKTFLIGSG